MHRELATRGSSVDKRVKTNRISHKRKPPTCLKAAAVPDAPLYTHIFL